MKILIILGFVNVAVVAGNAGPELVSSTTDNLTRSFNKNFALAHSNFLKKVNVYLTETSTKSKVNAILSQIISVYKPQYDVLINNNVKDSLDLSGFQKFYDFLSATTSLAIKQNNINFEKFNKEAEASLEDADFTFIQTTINILNYILGAIRKIPIGSENRKICARNYADKYTTLMNKAYEGIYNGPKNCLDESFDINAVSLGMQEGIDVWTDNYRKLKKCLEDVGDKESKVDSSSVARECIKNVSLNFSHFSLYSLSPSLWKSQKLKFYFIFFRYPHH